MTLILLAALLQDLGDEVRDPAAGTAIRFPAGWKVQRAEGRSASARGEKAVIHLERVEYLEPQTVRRPSDMMVEAMKKEQEGVEILAQDDVALAGLKCRRIVARWKGTASWRYLVRMGPYDGLILQGHWPQEDEKAGAALIEKVAASLSVFTPEEPAECVDRLAAAVQSLKTAKLPAARIGVRHLVFAMDGKDISKLRLTISEAAVKGGAGYKTESHSRLVGGAGARQTDDVRCEFLLDGSYQKGEWERVCEADGKKRVFTATAVIEKGKCTVTRTIEGESETSTFDVKEGTYLDIVADESRAALAMNGKALLAQRVLHFLGRDRTIVELMEVEAPAKMKVSGAAARVVRVVSSNLVGLRYRTFIYEEDGRLASYRYPKANGESRAVSAEDFEKIKLPGE